MNLWALKAVALILALAIASPPAVSADRREASIARHPVWIEEPALGDKHRDAVRQAARRGNRAERVLRMLDWLNLSRSPIADDDHGEALLAYLQLPDRQRRRLHRRMDEMLTEAGAARRTGNRDALRQFQTRASVITSELAERRPDLDRRSTRRRLMRDLDRLLRFAHEATWERHVLNRYLRGPMRLGTVDPGPALKRFYQNRDHAVFGPAERTRYLEVLAELEGGGPDAINAYDWGGVSVGIAQFAASGPYLGQLLRRVENERPERYRKAFTGRDLSVNADGFLHLDGRPLILAISEMNDQNEFNPVLLAFIDLLSERKLRRSLFQQQEELADILIDTAMALQAEDGVCLSRRLLSPRGRAHLADAFINTGADDTLRAFDRARRRVSDVGGSVVEAFVDARREFYDRTGQSYQSRRIDAIEARFAEGDGKRDEAQSGKCGAERTVPELCQNCHQPTATNDKTACRRPPPKLRVVCDVCR